MLQNLRKLGKINVLKDFVLKNYQKIKQKNA